MHWTQEDLDELEIKRGAWVKVGQDAKDTLDSGLESSLQRKCQKYCDEHGYPWFHDRSRKMNNPGWPDMIIFGPESNIVLIELKSAVGKLRSEQKALQLALRWLGHEIHVVRSFKRFLEIMMKMEGKNGKNST